MVAWDVPRYSPPPRQQEDRFDTRRFRPIGESRTPAGRGVLIRQPLNAVGKVSPDQLFIKLFTLYDVRNDRGVCVTDFEFVHGLAQQFMGGRLADSSVGHLFPDEFRRATFSCVDLDGDGCISLHDFESWLKALMARMSRLQGYDRKRPHVLIKHVIYMLQADKCFLAYRSLVLSSKRLAEQDDSRELFAAIAAFEETLHSVEITINDDEVIAQFQQQLTARRLDLKRKLQAAVASADTLRARQNALGELTMAKSVLLLEPTELVELSRCKDMVKAACQPFKIHVSTLAGPDVYVEASAEESVWSLRVKVNAELNQGRHAYQVRLSNAHGQLAEDSATLAEYLLCSSQGEGIVATYVAADRWVEFSHVEFKEFHCQQANEVARLYRRVHETERKMQGNASEDHIVELMMTKAEAYCYKTWQTAAFEDILIETAKNYGRMERRRVLKPMVRALRRRGLVEV